MKDFWKNWRKTLILANIVFLTLLTVKIFYQINQLDIKVDKRLAKIEATQLVIQEVMKQKYDFTFEVEIKDKP